MMMIWIFFARKEHVVLSPRTQNMRCLSKLHNLMAHISYYLWIYLLVSAMTSCRVTLWSILCVQATLIDFAVDSFMKGWCVYSLSVGESWEFSHANDTQQRAQQCWIHQVAGNPQRKIFHWDSYGARMLVNMNFSASKGPMQLWPPFPNNSNHI